MKAKTKRIARKTITLIFAIAVALFILLPFYWLVTLSFKRDAQIYTATPQPFSYASPFYANYYMLLTGNLPPGWSPEDMAGSRLARVPMYSQWFIRAFVNTVYTSALTTLICIVAGALSAYAFVTSRFPLKNKLYIGYFATRTIPATILLIPTFMVFLTLRWTDKNEAIILVLSGILLPYAIWILKEYFATIPRDLYDAARVDGCSRFGILWKIFFPVAMPGIIAAAIFVFMAVWQSFLVALILSRSVNSMQMSVYVSNFITDVDIDEGFMATAGVFAAIPPIIIAFLFQKYIVRGLMQGAIKG